MSETGVRLDKWLWAARFFKTRGLARDAIDGGKIRIDGVKAKPSKAVLPCQIMTISRAQTELIVEVIAVREDRRPASEAALLYQETEASRAKREAEQDMRRYERAGFQPTDHRPNKRERRQLTRLKGAPE
jgi:ribosome-associated heat shock protein Hsp15